MAKKINHRGHGGHRELLFSLCPLCSPWFSEPIPEDNKKSLIVLARKNRIAIRRSINIHEWLRFW